MNYQKIHDQIIERAKTRQLEGYKEQHHIVPKCIGGTNDKDNLVSLTAREHFIIHKILCEIHPTNKKLHDAVWCMIHLVNKHHQRGYVVSNREYEYLKKRRSVFLSETQSGENNPFFGKTHSIENKKLFGENAKKLHTGRKRTQQTKDNIRNGLLNSEKHKQAVQDPEYRNQISETVSKLWEDPDSIYNTTEYRNKLKTAQLKWHKENPKVDIQLLQTSLDCNPKSIASALRYYNSLANKTISRPTFDKWRKLL
jgi:hypothetical protein